ncbi:MAG TPA: glycine cleavage system protein H, partial [Pseudomonadales bacterium]|nr:glycine cleavage system protein H [Pseudomonadales bacterium]HNN66725.1 glycine cleavage system protein H [Pseudomonadales bacterium]
APVSGTVVEVNDALGTAPELVNQSPYEQGWFFRIEPSDLTELDGLLDADGYADVVEG